MRRHIPIRAALAAATATAATIGFAAAGASAGTWHAAGALPHHVFAPYFETYDTSGGSLAALSRESGAKYLALAFIQTAQAGSCTAYWNGSTSEPISYSSFGSDISAVQATGGNVIPSFGGYSADTTGTEIADSCSSVPAIAQVYEKLITTWLAAIVWPLPTLFVLPLKPSLPRYEQAALASAAVTLLSFLPLCGPFLV